MPLEKRWEVLPQADLSEQANWRKLGNQRYAAFRARLLFVRSKGTTSLFGPIESAYNVAPGDTITIKYSRARVISHTETITQAVRFTVTERVCDRLAAKVSAELSAKVPGFSAKLGSEFTAHQEYEVSTALEENLSTTRSHTLQETEEREHTISLTGQGESRQAELRRRYWPQLWDVYLYSFDYLELRHRISWFWKDVRETIRQTYSPVIGWPLLRLTFHQPQSDLDVCYQAVREIEDPTGVVVETLGSEMPRSRPSALEPLEELARLAFPVTGPEIRAAAHHRRRPRKAAPRPTKRKPARKKAAPKKKAAKKKAAKKKAAKKRAAPRKKAAKKRPAKRKAVKRRAAKKR